MANTTHYENLKVARDAPGDVIRAAYKELIQQYASDQNPSAEASRLMKIVHNSYSILSNPIQKNKYDQWLLEQESVAVEVKKTGSGGQSGQPAGKRSNIYPMRTVEPVIPGQAIGNAEATRELTLVAGKEIADAPDAAVNTRRNRRWYAAIGVLALIAIAWYGLQDSAPQDQNQHPLMPNETRAVAGKTDQASDTLPAPQSAQGPVMQAAGIPAHDQAAINAFVGLWKGVTDPSGVQQTLDISLKSDSSLVFRLDTKAGSSIGGLYGVAHFEDGIARFHNEEYGCGIVFSFGSGNLRLASSNCRAFYRNNAVFDGTYMKPESIKIAPQPVAAGPVTATPAAIPDIASAPQPEAAPPAAAKPVPKLRKYVATVRNPDGGTTTIELLAKDKDSARAIIRDFRGNPKVMKLKEVKK